MGLDETPHKLTLSWRDFVDHADEYLLFGTPFHQSRSFENIFRNKADIEYAHHVFRKMAVEYRGDSRASYALFAHYQKRKCQSWELMAEKALAEKEGVFAKQSWSDQPMKDFRREFDKLCRDGFIACLSGWNDYTQPIISHEDFSRFLVRAKMVYPRQWKFLSGLRNINKKDRDELRAYKERQVFCTILSLQRQANYKELTYWALIQTTAFYGWGAKNTVVNGSAFWGNTIGRVYRDREYSRLIDGITEKQMELPSKDSGVSVVWDNHQLTGQALRDQRSRSPRTLMGLTRQLCECGCLTIFASTTSLSRIRMTKTR